MALLKAAACGEQSMTWYAVVCIGCSTTKASGRDCARLRPGGSESLHSAGT